MSSVRIRSAAFFATSVPVIPIATPTSAAFREGASLTPSPVMATILPEAFSAFTMRTLCSGDTWANTERLRAAARNSLSDRASICGPLIQSEGFSAMPSSWAMTKAVSLRSPVIMTVFTPAWRKSCTALTASGRIGSIIPARPMKVSLSSEGVLSPVRIARASRRRARPESV